MLYQQQNEITEQQPFPLTKHQTIFITNIVFWFLFILFDSITTSATLNGYFSYTFTRTLMHSIPFGLLIYTNTYWLYPRFFAHQHYLKYTLFSIILLIIHLLMRFQIDDFMSSPENIENYLYVIYDPILSQKALDAFINGGFFNEDGVFSFQYYLGMSIGSIGIFLLSSIINLVEDWSDKQRLKFQMLRDKAKAQQIDLELKAKEVELQNAKIKFLKAQTDPHFLINALSGVYNLALLQNDQVNFAILRLSDLMSYLLGKGKEDFISLQSEVDFIKNYLTFTKVIYLNEVNISFDCLVSPHELTNIDIPPMLFQPFLENALKHGDAIYHSKGWIKSQLNLIDKQLVFELENTIEPKSKIHHIKSHGVGLINLKERLKIYFPNNHKLTINRSSTKYEIQLILNVEKLL